MSEEEDEILDEPPVVLPKASDAAAAINVLRLYWGEQPDGMGEVMSLDDMMQKLNHIAVAAKKQIDHSVLYHTSTTHQALNQFASLFCSCMSYCLVFTNCAKDCCVIICCTC